MTFTTSADGELYGLAYAKDGTGSIVRLAPEPPKTDTFPRRLSETGCVDANDPRKPAPGVIPYVLRSELWSDGSQKERFLALPDGGHIRVRDDGDFEFPEGTVLVKHFRYDDRYHETRLFMRHSDGWGGYSYRWNEDGTDAELLDTAHVETLPSGVRWTYPSRAQCSACHTEAAGFALGPEVAQFDRAHAFGTAFPSSEVAPTTSNQLDALLARGYLARNVTAETLSPLRQTPLVEPHGDAPIEDRARSWLHGNCASCHRPGGTTARGDLDLRFGTSFADTGLCNREPSSGRPWYAPNWRDMLLFVPGRPELSVLHHRLVTSSQFRMPPLASSIHDEAGVELIRTWIESTRTCPTPAE